MRTAAKVFVWIGLIFGFYLIFPLVIGIIALKKLSRSTDLNELHNFGIVTLFFCNFLGGLFMMLIDDEKVNDKHCDAKKENTQIIHYINIPRTKEELRTETSNGVVTFSRIGILIVAALTVACLILSLITFGTNGYYYKYGRNREYIIETFEPWLTTIPAIICIIVLIIAIIFYFLNNQYVDLQCNATLIVNLFLQCALFICSTISYCVGYTVLFCPIFIFSLSNMILLIIVISVNHNVFNTKRKIVTSKLEIELSEAKRLLDNNIITNDEYEKMREGIISKYI